MPKLLCKCGEVLSFSEIPCAIEWRLISDVDFSPFFEGHVDASKIYEATRTVLLCPKCGRLWIFWDDEGDPREYLPAAPPAGP